MKQSVELSEAQIAHALKLLGAALTSRLHQKGRDSFINFHEILGATEVEVHELREAVHGKKPVEVISELLDVAVGSIVGIASVHAHYLSPGKEGQK